MSKQVVIIGASRGIGEELVHQFAKQEDCQVLALSRNSKQMSEVFSEYPSVTCVTFDLDGDKVRETAERIFAEVDKIDIIINNAGKLVNKPFLSLTAEDIRSCYQVNVMGVFSVMQAALPKMSAGAHSVMISSMGGFQGSVKFAGLSAYSTSKAALASLTELLAEEYKESGIAFNCLALGAAQTEMLEEAFPGYQAPVSASQMATFIADFSSSAHQWIKGKIIPVSLSTP